MSLHLGSSRDRDRALCGEVVVVVGGYLYIAKRDWLLTYLRKVNWTGASVFFFLFWTMVTTYVLYLSMISPQHAMAARYMATVWPFVAFLPVFLLRLSKGRARIYLLIFFCVMPLILGLMRPIVLVSRSDYLATEIDTVERVVVDNIARGVLLPILWYIPDGAQVYVAPQEDLSTTPDKWLTPLVDNGVYISQVAYNSTLDGLMTNLSLMCQQYIVTEIPRAGYIGFVFVPQTGADEPDVCGDINNDS